MELVPDIFIPPSRQAEWEALSAGYLADYQPGHHAFTCAVGQLAEADFTRRTRNRDTACLEARLYTEHPGLDTAQWPLSEQKRWETCQKQARAADRLFHKWFRIAEQLRRRRDRENARRNPFCRPGQFPTPPPPAIRPGIPQPPRTPLTPLAATAEQQSPAGPWDPARESTKIALFRSEDKKAP